MIDIPTLFILGAGASNPYGYPTGDGLRADIINNFDSYFNKLLDINPPNIPLNVLQTQRAIPRFIEHFKGSSIASIDKYLALNPIDSYIGKIAITLSILKSERESCFREDIKDTDEDWYKLLFNRMTSSFNKPDDYKHFCDNKVAFITFNYDRSLEYFLYDSFYHSFYEKRHDIENNIENYVSFPIIHVYGSVANISPADWYKNGCNYYGNFNYFKSVENLSERIRVIGEERSDNGIKEQIEDLLKNYERIFFLGFSYAQDNLEAIDLLKNINKKTTRIYGTAYGMKRKEIKDISRRFPVIEGETYLVDGEEIDTSFYPKIEYKKCYDFLREHL